MSRVLLMLTFLVSLTVAKVGLAEEPEAKGVVERDLIGLYEMVSGEKNGEKLPAERIAGHKVRFTDNKIVATDAENSETFTCTYKLDPSRAPSVITMTSTVKGHEGQVAKGLILADGNEVRLIYTLPNSLEAPTKFKTQEGQLMVVLKKVKEK